MCIFIVERIHVSLRVPRLWRPMYPSIKLNFFIKRTRGVLCLDIQLQNTLQLVHNIFERFKFHFRTLINPSVFNSFLFFLLFILVLQMCGIINFEETGLSLIVRIDFTSDYNNT